jgi:uncharacterized protein YecT (DUF1311 family)
MMASTFTSTSPRTVAVAAAAILVGAIATAPPAHARPAPAHARPAPAHARPAPHARAAQTRLSPPTVQETFTPLPCTGKPADRTTLQLEGCAEQQILKSDRVIDSLNGQIFAKLDENSARSRFILAHDAWLHYRNDFCASESDVFAGGTEAGVLAADCDAELDAQHVQNLREFLHDLSANG